MGWINKYRKEVRPKLSPTSSEDHAVFLTMAGKRFHPNRLGFNVHQIIDKAGIGKHGSCHVFRHTFATLLLENGCDIRFVQEMLGHTNIKTTSIYTHVAMKTLKEMHTRCHPIDILTPGDPGRSKDSTFTCTSSYFRHRANPQRL